MSEKITQDEWIAEIERLDEQSPKDRRLTEVERRRLNYRKQGMSLSQIALKENIARASVKETFQKIRHKARLIQALKGGERE